MAGYFCAHLISGNDSIIDNNGLMITFIYREVF